MQGKKATFGFFGGDIAPLPPPKSAYDGEWGKG